MMRICSKSNVFIWCLLFFSWATQAQSLNGYIAPLASGQFHITSQDNIGIRAGGRLEFARIQKWIALNFRFATGSNYEDGGGALRFYNYWESKGGDTYTLGMGPGIVAARKGDSQRPGLSFNDYFVETAFTYLTLVGDETALIFQAGFDSVILRAFPGDDKDGRVRVRPFVNLGLAFGA